MVQETLESSSAPQFESITSLALKLLYGKTLTSAYDYWKNHRFDYTDLCHKVMFLLFNMLSRLVIAFLSKNKHLNFMAAVTICSDFGAKKIIKTVTVSIVSPSICHEVM